MDKVSANKQKKIETVEKLVEKLQKAKALVFANYQGLTHKQLEDLKKKIRPLEAEMEVTKNTLLKRALDKTGDLKLVEDEKALDQPTVTMFIYNDLVEPLKHLAKVIKELNIPTIKFGILDKKSISSEQVLKLASLPPKEVLLAQLFGNMKSPISNFVLVLNSTTQKFVMTLGAIAKTKPSDAPVAEPVAPTIEQTAATEPTESVAEELKTKQSEVSGQESEVIQTEEPKESQNKEEVN
jgi:large subunit ribosomal protein L10